MTTVALAIFEYCTPEPGKASCRNPYIAIPVSLKTEGDDAPALAARPFTESDRNLLDSIRHSIRVDKATLKQHSNTIVSQVSSVVSRSPRSGKIPRLWALLPANTNIPLNEWFDPRDVTRAPREVSGIPDPEITIPGFLSFVDAISRSEHDYKESVVTWIQSGLIMFGTKSRSDFGPSLHVEHIQVRKTGIWSLSEFMSLDAIIGDYLCSIGMDQSEIEPNPSMRY